MVRRARTTRAATILLGRENRAHGDLVSRARTEHAGIRKRAGDLARVRLRELKALRDAKAAVLPAMAHGKGLARWLREPRNLRRDVRRVPRRRIVAGWKTVGQRRIAAPTARRVDLLDIQDLKGEAGMAEGVHRST